jgi:hypothetical protein
MVRVAREIDARGLAEGVRAARVVHRAGAPHSATPAHAFARNAAVALGAVAGAAAAAAVVDVAREYRAIRIGTVDRSRAADRPGVAAAANPILAADASPRHAARAPLAGADLTAGAAVGVVAGQVHAGRWAPIGPVAAGFPSRTGRRTGRAEVACAEVARLGAFWLHGEVRIGCIGRPRATCRHGSAPQQACEKSAEHAHAAPPPRGKPLPFPVDLHHGIRNVATLRESAWPHPVSSRSRFDPALALTRGRRWPRRVRR